ncbi:MAG: hypothetical protein AB7O96_19860 [Pseudobdellovibrionaceae bacterium]
MLNKVVVLFLGSLLTMPSAFAQKPYNAPPVIDDIPVSFSVPTTVIARLDMIFKSYQKENSSVADCKLRHLGYITEPSDGSQLGFKIEIAKTSGQKAHGFRILPTAQKFSSEKNAAGQTQVQLTYLTEGLMGPRYHGIQVIFNAQNQILSLEGFVGDYDQNGKLQASEPISCNGN